MGFSILRSAERIQCGQGIIYMVKIIKGIPKQPVWGNMKNGFEKDRIIEKYHHYRIRYI